MLNALIDIIVYSVFGGDQRAIERFWGIFFAVLFVIFAVVFYFVDRKLRNPKGLSKVLAIVSSASFGAMMSGFALACGFGKYELALIFFGGVLLIFGVIWVIYWFKVERPKAQRRNRMKKKKSKDWNKNRTWGED